jgi:hypothetical protein
MSPKDRITTIVLSERAATQSQLRGMDNPTTWPAYPCLNCTAPLLDSCQFMSQCQMVFLHLSTHRTTSKTQPMRHRSLTILPWSHIAPVHLSLHITQPWILIMPTPTCLPSSPPGILHHSRQSPIPGVLGEHAKIPSPSLRHFPYLTMVLSLRTDIQRELPIHLNGCQTSVHRSKCLTLHLCGLRKTA